MRSVSWLAFGALVGQALQAVAIPAITRVFSPASLGAWAVVQSLVVTGASIAGLRYELAMPLVRDLADARSIAHLQMACATLVACLVAMLFAWDLFLPSDLVSMFDSTLLVAAAFVLVLGGALFQLLGQAYIRDTRFGVLAALRGANGPGQTIAQLGIGWFTHGRPMALLAGAAVGTLLSLTIGWKEVQRFFLRGPFSSLRQLKTTSARFRHFPLFVVPYSLITLARDRGSFLIIAAYLDLTAVGLVAIAQRLVTIPVGLVSAAISPVIHQRLASSDDRRLLEPDVAGVVVGLTWIGTSFFGMLAGSAATIVPLLLGPEWQAADAVCVALAGWGLSMSLSAVFDRTFDIVNRQSVALWIEGSSSLLSLTALWILIASGSGLAGALLVFAGVQVVHHLLWIAGAWLSVGFSPRGLRSLGLQLLLAAGSALTIFAILRNWLQQ